jgi:Fe-S-cluster containining protein
VSGFLCSGCGACCLKAGFFKPKLDRGDGGCKHLDDDMSCEIYEDRPDFCRVGYSYKKGLIDTEKLSLKDYHKMNTRFCHILIDELGLDEKFKIDIEEYDK